MATQPEPRITQSLNVLRSMRVESSGCCELTWIFPVGSEIWAPQKHHQKQTFYCRLQKFDIQTEGLGMHFVDSSLFVMVDPWWQKQNVKHEPFVSNVFLGDSSHPKTLRFFAFLKNFETFKASRTFGVIFSIKDNMGFPTGCGGFIQIFWIFTLIFGEMIQSDLYFTKGRKKSSTSNWKKAEDSRSFLWYFFCGEDFLCIWK